ncbi:MAG: hydrogenase 3 maturation endopeptidase HyCI [Rudaea sp.]
MERKKMCGHSWKEQLAKELARLRPIDRSVRLAVLGVGNELLGDDGVGIRVARSVLASPTKPANLLVIDSGDSPESVTGPLRHFEPDLIILVDAAQMDAEPGEIRWLEPQVAMGFSASTHSLPLSLVAGFMEDEFQCPVALIGIQPSSNQVLTGLSDPVRRAAAEVEAHLLQL